MVNDLKIARRMASKRFERVEDIFLELSISKGWIKYIRTLYAMTLSQLAKRLGVSVATISTAEGGALAKRHSHAGGTCRNRSRPPRA